MATANHTPSTHLRLLPRATSAERKQAVAEQRQQQLAASLREYAAWCWSIRTGSRRPGHK